MQFIEELTLIHKVAIGATVCLIMVLLMVSARRRKAAAPSEARTAPVAKTSRRRGRVKKDSALPRRKRRALAAEAAHAMSVEATPFATPAPEVGITVPEVGITVPEVTVAQAIASPVDEAIEAAFVAERIAAEPVAVAANDDRYLQDTLMDDAGAFVAQPGWPSPGELASSFDPDAFDPLPEMHEPQQDETQYDGTPEAVEYDDTYALELPDLSTADEVTALAQIEEWADSAEAGTEWDDTDDAGDETLTSGNWTISEQQNELEAAFSDSEPMDMEDIWSEPDEESSWNQAGEAEPASEEVVHLDTALDEDPTFEPAIAEEAFEVPVAEDTTFDDVTALADDSPSAWQASDGPETNASLATVAAGWSGSIGGQSSPVVLDLAGLAASGQSLELVIEPNADGHGVRLRFGAPTPMPGDAPVVTTAGLERLSDDEPGADHTEAPVTPEAEREVEVAAVAEHDSAAWNVPFLAGVVPADEPESAADPAESPEALVGAQPEHLVADTPEVPETVVFEEPEPPVSEATITFADLAPPAALDASTYAHDGLAFDPEPCGPSNASAVMDADDNPARILADIRARLAALDAQR